MRRHLAVLALLTLTLAACGDSGAGPSEPAAVVVTGTWRLRTYNGAALPVTVSQSGTTRTEITDDIYSLNADGTFSELVSGRVTNGVTTTSTSVAIIGVYTNTNGAIRFVPTTPTGFNPYQGSVNGSTLTIVGSGATYVYGR